MLKTMSVVKTKEGARSVCLIRVDEKGRVVWTNAYWSPFRSNPDLHDREFKEYLENQRKWGWEIEIRDDEGEAYFRMMERLGLPPAYLDAIPEKFRKRRRKR